MDTPFTLWLFCACIRVFHMPHKYIYLPCTPPTHKRILMYFFCKMQFHSLFYIRKIFFFWLQPFIYYGYHFHLLLLPGHNFSSSQVVQVLPSLILRFSTRTFICDACSWYSRLTAEQTSLNCSNAGHHCGLPEAVATVSSTIRKTQLLLLFLFPRAYYCV